MKKLQVYLILVMVSFVFCSLAVAQERKTVVVKANIPNLGTVLDVAVSKVMVSDRRWITQPSLEMNFGTLGFDTRTYTLPGDTTARRYYLFRTGTGPNFTDSFYFAVDIGVIDNSGRSWTITHTPTTISGPGGKNLNNNVNVAFVWAKTGVADQLIERVAYGNSYKQFTKSQVPSGAWLRVYYGIASGITTTTPGFDPTRDTPDATGVVPITSESHLAGEYMGSVTITLTVS